MNPVREKMDACLIFPSMPAVMKLNKLGTFSMAQLGQSKSVFSEFIKSARKVRLHSAAASERGRRASRALSCAHNACAGFSRIRALATASARSHHTCAEHCPPAAGTAVVAALIMQNNDNFEEGLLKLVRTLPKVLKYLPSDKAKDARNFVNSLQYWLGGNTDNLENLLLNISSSYVPALQGVDFSVEEPTLPPDVGIWHPLAPMMYEDLKEYLNW